VVSLGIKGRKSPKLPCLGFALPFLAILVETAAAQTNFNLLKSSDFARALPIRLNIECLDDALVLGCRGFAQSK